MAELVKELVLVSLGMGIGVVLMCIAQVSKMADEEMEEIKKERWSYVKKKYKLNMPFLRLAYPARASAFSSNAA